MLFIGPLRFSCETCLRGHRPGRCKHETRALTEVRPKGRPKLITRPAKLPPQRIKISGKYIDIKFHSEYSANYFSLLHSQGETLAVCTGEDGLEPERGREGNQKKMLPPAFSPPTFHLRHNPQFHPATVQGPRSSCPPGQQNDSNSPIVGKTICHEDNHDYMEQSRLPYVLGASDKSEQPTTESTQFWDTKYAFPRNERDPYADEEVNSAARFNGSEKTHSNFYTSYSQDPQKGFQNVGFLPGGSTYPNPSHFRQRKQQKKQQQQHQHQHQYQHQYQQKNSTLSYNTHQNTNGNGNYDRNQEQQNYKRRTEMSIDQNNTEQPYGLDSSFIEPERQRHYNSYGQMQASIANDGFQICDVRGCSCTESSPINSTDSHGRAYDSYPARQFNKRNEPQLAARANFQPSCPNFNNLRQGNTGFAPVVLSKYKAASSDLEKQGTCTAETEENGHLDHGEFTAIRPQTSSQILLPMLQSVSPRARLLHDDTLQSDSEFNFAIASDTSARSEWTQLQQSHNCAAQYDPTQGSGYSRTALSEGIWVSGNDVYTRIAAKTAKFQEEPVYCRHQFWR